MAYSTQKGFQHVPFLNEYPQPICPPMEGIKLKTYACTRDERAWSRSDEKKAQYLIDLVSCRMYDDHAAGDGLEVSFNEPNKKSADLGSLDKESQDEKEIIRSIKADKEALKSRLDESLEKLESLREEKNALNAIISQNHHPESIDAIKRKISQLRHSSKIDKNDENELLKMLDGLHKNEKAFNAVKVENNYLRQSIDKFSIRSDSSNASSEPETNTDIYYLQQKVNNLRKEIALLRSTDRKETVSRGNQSMENFANRDSESIANIKAERNALREKCDSFASAEGKIIEWKNDAEQFKCFRKKACLALKQKDEEIQDYRERNEEIEYEFREMVKCFKAKEQEKEVLCSAYDCLKEENQRLKQELCKNNCDLKAITTLQNQIQLLSNELCEKNCAIEQYDIQFQQLLNVIESIQNKTSLDIRSLQDVDSQTHNEHIEELAASTRATLNQISKELDQRHDLEIDLAESRAELEKIRRESQEKENSTKEILNAKENENQQLKQSLERASIAVRRSFEELRIEANTNEDCSVEINRLRELLIKMKSEHEDEKELLNKKSADLLRDLENEKKKGTGVESVSDEANNLKTTLASAHDESRQLRNQNQALNEALEECQQKIKAQQEEIRNLDKKTTELLCSSEASLKEVGKLVTDITNVQDRNENLKSVLGAVDYSDQYKKEIEDLKTLLDEERKKNHFVAEQNKEKEMLQEEVKKNQLLTEQNNELLEEEMKKNQLLSAQNKDLQTDLDKANELISSQKKTIESQINDERNKGVQKASDKSNENISLPRKSTRGDNQTFRAIAKQLPDDQEANSRIKSIPRPSDVSELTRKIPDGQETESKMKPLSKPSDASMPNQTSSDKKSSIKIAQLQKIHEATRNAERIYYEKEIEGHRLSNELLKDSLTKLTSKVQSSSAAEFEKEMRSVLDTFAKEICQWRCEKNFKKLTKLQEICKKILEHGIYCLAYKELVYLHQRMSEAALKLKPNCLSTSSSGNEQICCKCSGQICEIPFVSRDNKILLEKMVILEREIQTAREDLRRRKEEKELGIPDKDQSDPDTLRASSYQTNCLTRKSISRPKSSRVSYKIKEEEYEIPTKDKYEY